MRSVSTTEAKQQLAAVLDAAQSGPVVIRRRSRDIAVILSPQEYDRLRNLNSSEFQAFADRVSISAVDRGMNEIVLGKLLKDNG
jgi:prevent-host-death family protein